jgi:hypothetical protein
MTHREAYDKALKSRWKTSVCISGPDCWCRIIEPEEKIEYDEGLEEVYIAGMGCIPKDFAEHIVKLHNDSLEAHR